MPVRRGSALKSWVFKSFLKVERDAPALVVLGSSFHQRGTTIDTITLPPKFRICENTWCCVCHALSESYTLHHLASHMSPKQHELYDTERRPTWPTWRLASTSVSVCVAKHSVCLCVDANTCVWNLYMLSFPVACYIYTLLCPSENEFAVEEKHVCW